MARYLYGASVQGIQSFIFQTNKLREIVGASEIVEEICSSFFKSQFKKLNIDYSENNLLMGAAGNIKYVFESKEDCRQIVKFFPKAVMEKADGITISQAVVEEGKHKDDIQELEKRLRVQRNKAISIRDTAGLMVTETARRTGGVGFQYHKDEVIDLGQKQKLEASEAANERLTQVILGSKKFQAAEFPFDISEMIKGEKNQSWIAVIHADGNSLGNKLIKMGRTLKGKKARAAFKDFSEKLDTATKEAVKTAFKKIIEPVIKDEKLKRIPFRPVLLGGDDLTAIVRGDLALDYTQIFLEEFERFTAELFENFDSEHKIGELIFSKGLTACAGIAYIKANYPFHYGETLAQSLCKKAKDASRGINSDHSPSSIMFHKVHSSFIEDFDDIIEKELRAKDNVFFNYGPYFVKKQKEFDSIYDLKNRIKELNRKDAPKSGLRNWLIDLQNNKEVANQTLERIIALNNNYVRKLGLDKPFTERHLKLNGEGLEGKFTPIFDAITLSKIVKTSRK